MLINLKVQPVLPEIFNYATGSREHLLPTILKHTKTSLEDIGFNDLT